MINSTDSIKSWDERLKDQAMRHWDNYSHIHLDLTTARVDEEFVVPGDFLFVENVSDDEVAEAKIKLNNNNNDSLDLEDGVEIYTVFTKFYITHEALQDEWLDIVCGINFIYKKKIAGGDGFVNPIVTAPGVDLQLLPGAGGITQIGDAGATSHGLAANDDLFVSGKFEVDGLIYLDGNSYVHGVMRHLAAVRFILDGAAASYLNYTKVTDTITIIAGQGMAGVAGAVNLALANSTLIGVVAQVLQAPGGGATTIDIGRTGGGNLDEFIDGIGTALNTEGHFAANHDAVTTGPVLNAAADTFTVTTDANVVGASLIVRIYAFNRTEHI